MILLHLPERDLLLNQRVSTEWRNAIKTSPQIQRELFYKVDVYDPVSTTTDWVWNPLLKFALITGGGLSSSKSETKITRASWNDMFLTQPATSEVGVELPLAFDFYRDGEQPLGSEITSLQEPEMRAVNNPSGVTMEDIWSTGWIAQEVARVNQLGGKHIAVRFMTYSSSGVSRSRCLFLIPIPSV